MRSGSLSSRLCTASLLLVLCKHEPDCFAVQEHSPFALNRIVYATLEHLGMSSLAVNEGGAPKSHDEDDVFKSLVAWIISNGGTVHSSLKLCHNTNHRGRGVFSSTDISRGETLICLPSRLALSGQDMPRHYDKQQKRASPWLTCLAALYQAKQSWNNSEAVTDDNKTKSTDYTPYLDSLPSEYDSLLNWTDEETASNLGGTALGESLQKDRQEQTMQQRYRIAVRPYLQETLVLSKEEGKNGFDEFLQACMCLSTRGFHLSKATTTTLSSKDHYSGPILLPLIDLLNHDAVNKCTTLQRDSSDNQAFVMVAERDIPQGHEICHSYGDNLTSAQLLQTFGFVSHHATLQCIERDRDSNNMTPAVLSKSNVIQACGRVARQYAPELRRYVESNDNIQDETWDVPLLEEMQGRDYLPSLIADNLVVSCAVTDELVTLCCLAFLPRNVYHEFMTDDHPALLERSTMMEDYFLGKLVCRALLDAVSDKLAEYKPIVDVLEDNSNSSDDEGILSWLLAKQKEDNGLTRFQIRAMYGITIRMEEKACLHALRKELLRMLDSMDDGYQQPQDELDQQQDGSLKRARIC